MSAREREAPPGRPTPLETQLSAEIARLMSEFYGRGPRKSRAHVLDRLVFVALEQPLTVAEEALIRAGQQQLVREARITFEDIMGHAFVDQVEALTQRSVVGYHSQFVVEPPLALEWFLLDPSQPPPAGPGPPLPAQELEPGRPGDADRASSDAEDFAASVKGGGGAGAVRATISNVVNRLMREHAGRGATAVRTYVVDDYVLCVLDDALTTVEQTLGAGERGDLARRLRDAVMATCQAELLSEVGAIVGRPAIALEAQIVFSPDVLMLTVVLG